MEGTTTPTVRQEIPPLDLDEALRRYQRHLADMTDEQLATEQARLEALPGHLYRNLANRESEARQAVEHEREVRSFAELLAAMAPATHWGWAR